MPNRKYLSTVEAEICSQVTFSSVTQILLHAYQPMHARAHGYVHAMSPSWEGQAKESYLLANLFERNAIVLFGGAYGQQSICRAPSISVGKFAAAV